MEKNEELIAEGSVCAVDGSCCGGAEAGATEDAATCTLTPSEMPERVARWQRLFGGVLSSDVQPGEAAFVFHNNATVRGELNELIKLERVCCAHVSWSLDESPDRLILILRAGSGALMSLVNGFMPSAPEENRS